MICHDTHNPFFRDPAGPVPAGTAVTFRILCDDAADVILRTWMGEERAYPMRFDSERVWEVQVKLPEETGIYWYDFIVYHHDGVTQRYGAPDDDLGGEGHLCEEYLHSFRITLYQPEWHTPSWIHGAVIYQIFPDRFFRAPAAAEAEPDSRRRFHEDWNEDFFPLRERENGSMDFYGGTLNGIREKIPYLQSMGVTVLYLNPIFKSQHNHHYDTGDYTLVDPMLGTNADFESLCRACEAAGIRIILDGVFSHTGQDSLYFNAFGNYPGVGAAQSKPSPYASWYTFEHFPNKYRCWWGDPSLPECRKDDPSYQRFIFDEQEGIVPRWLRAGADGWRLDVADELTMDFLRKLHRSARHAKRDAFVLGEVWEDASNKVAYGETRCYCTGDTLDSVMNYPLRTEILRFVRGEGNAYELARLIRHQAEVYPVPFRYALMNLLGSHDRARVLNAVIGKEGEGLTRAQQQKEKLSPEEYEVARRRLKICVDLICALPGCPTLYYGDEAGLTGCSDPFCRKPFPWGREDTELQAYIAAKLSHRRRSSLLKTGYCEVEALDEDTLRVRRFMLDGHDALGRKSAVHSEELFSIRR